MLPSMHPPVQERKCAWRSIDRARSLHSPTMERKYLSKTEVTEMLPPSMWNSWSRRIFLPAFVSSTFSYSLFPCFASFTLGRSALLKVVPSPFPSLLFCSGGLISWFPCSGAHMSSPPPLGQAEGDELHPRMDGGLEGKGPPPSSIAKSRKKIDVHKCW